MRCPRDPRVWKAEGGGSWPMGPLHWLQLPVRLHPQSRIPPPLAHPLPRNAWAPPQGLGATNTHSADQRPPHGKAEACPRPPKPSLTTGRQSAAVGGFLRSCGFGPCPEFCLKGGGMGGGVWNPKVQKFTKKRTIPQNTILLVQNSIAFGRSTSQRIYPQQHTPKIGWKLHKYGLKHALHTLDDHFR